MLDIKEIATIIESRVSELEKRNGSASPEATLFDLFDVVNSKLDVNLAVLEIIVLGAMIVCAEKGDYRIPKPWTDRGLGVSAVTIPNRSLAGAMAYQDHKKVLTSPSSFFNRNRPDHPMDVFLCPQEVVNRAEFLRPGSQR